MKLEFGREKYITDKLTTLFTGNGSYQWGSKTFESPEANRALNMQHFN